MKKNISINISGIIFHIEEDGFEKLKQYLDSINKYFSTFEDSAEIIADIESRIAEIFLSKLKEESSQVVTLDDVEGLIGTMGTIADFKAAEEETKEPVSEPANEETVEEEKTEETRERPSKLYRDLNRQIIGGVASGIAYYFKIDPLWIRLILLIVLLNVFIGFGLSGLVLLGYIIMWIVVPGSKELVEDKKIKKMYRSSEDKVLGGVASGLAAYFGADITLIRLLFVLSIFLGGSGFIIYIILWIITPEAKSITEKMQMQGEPVTLSNIEHSVKDRSSAKDDQEEGAFTKILLFPFRLIGMIFKGLGELLGPATKFLLEALRVLVAIALIVIGLSFVVCLVVLTIVSFGIFTGLEAWVHLNDLPIEIFQGAFPNGSLLFLFLSLFIPALAIGLLGFTLLFKTTITNSYIGWALFGLWLIGIIGAAVTLPATIADFRRKGENTVNTDYDLKGKQAVLTVREMEISDYTGATLTLRGHTDSVFTLIQDFEARGADLVQARANANMIDYNVSLVDSIFTFDSNITFKPDAKFRFQEVSMILYIPYNEVFYMDRSLEDILRNTIHRNGYSVYDIPDNQWMFTPRGLDCITCEPKNDRRRLRDRMDDDPINDEPIGSNPPSRSGGDELAFDFERFDEIVATHKFELFITQGDDFDVRLYGREKDLDKVRLKQKGSTLELESRERRWLGTRNTRPIRVEITMPEIEKLTLEGACSVEAAGFSGNDLELELEGASRADLDVVYDEIFVELSGSSDLILSGEANELIADLSGTSSLQALELEAERGDIDAGGASSAQVYITEDLNAEATGASDIQYKGNPDLDESEGGAGSVRRYQ